MSQHALPNDVTDELDLRFEPISSSPRLTLRWALKRAILGIVILFVSIGGIVVLLDASIEKNTENVVVAPAKTASPILELSTQPIVVKPTRVQKASAATAGSN